MKGNNLKKIMNNLCNKNVTRKIGSVDDYWNGS